MKIITSINEMKEIRKELQGSVGFVPTLGGLHAGHTSLIEKSLEQNKITIVSIFLNPTQFNNLDDFKNYPSSIEQDKSILNLLNIPYLFMPTESEIYPYGYNYKISESKDSKILCGKYRSGHFEGVLTIVMKLLNLIKPTRIYLGEKDYQQLTLIKNMITDFFLDTEVISCPIIRDENGLALSTRNMRLTPEEKVTACLFAHILKNESDVKKAAEEITKLGLKIDYIEDWNSRRLAAVNINSIRLIDNVEK